MTSGWQSSIHHAFTLCSTYSTYTGSDINSGGLGPSQTAYTSISSLHSYPTCGPCVRFFLRRVRGGCPGFSTSSVGKNPEALLLFGVICSLFRQGVEETPATTTSSPKTVLPRRYLIRELCQNCALRSENRYVFSELLLTWRSLHQHWKSLSRHIQICGTLRDSHAFRDNRIRKTRDPPP